jgi:hypothetical protein
MQPQAGVPAPPLRVLMPGWAQPRKSHCIVSLCKPRAWGWAVASTGLCPRSAGSRACVRRHAVGHLHLTPSFLLRAVSWAAISRGAEPWGGDRWRPTALCQSVHAGVVLGLWVDAQWPRHPLQPHSTAWLDRVDVPELARAVVLLINKVPGCCAAGGEQALGADVTCCYFFLCFSHVTP